MSNGPQITSSPLPFLKNLKNYKPERFSVKKLYINRSNVEITNFNKIKTKLWTRCLKVKQGGKTYKEIDYFTIQ